MRALSLLALLALASCTGMGDLPDGHDSGGNVYAYAVRINQHRGPVEITGECSSACTMWAGYERACLRLPVTLGFHAVRNDPTGQFQRLYESKLPTVGADGGLRAWYRANAAHSRDLVRLSGATLIRNGWAHACA